MQLFGDGDKVTQMSELDIHTLNILIRMINILDKKLMAPYDFVIQDVFFISRTR
ncbi:hypothetical protein D3C80_2162170 [compost metagenome]